MSSKIENCWSTKGIIKKMNTETKNQKKTSALQTRGKRFLEIFKYRKRS